MSIQLGVPGAAGGGGGGGGVTDEIAAENGFVKVNADGSIDIDPGTFNLIRLKGTGTNAAPDLHWLDNLGIADGRSGVTSGSGDIFTGTTNGQMNLAGQTGLNLGVAAAQPSLSFLPGGNPGGKTLARSLGPYAYGVATVSTQRQFEWGGNYSADGSLPTKYLYEGKITAEPGAEEIIGHRLDNAYQTQAATETVNRIAHVLLKIPTITDLLTGGGLITNAVTLDIEGAPTEGVNNFALRVQNGLTSLDQILAGVGPHSFGSAISAPTQYQFRGNYTFPGSFGVKVLISDQLIGESGADEMRYLRVLPRFTTQAAAESLSILAGLTVGIPLITDLLTGGGTIGETVALEVSGASALGVNNWALRVKGGLTELEGPLVVSDVGPHAFGVAAVEADKQFVFGGDITLTGGAPTKFNLRDRIIGSAGASQYAGLKLNVEFQTQIESAEVDSMAALDISAPQIVNNLTGGNTILEAFTVRIQGPPTGADDNWSFKVDNGLTEFDDLQCGNGTSLLGFFGTGPSAKAAITGSRGANAALASLLTQLAAKGLITDSSSV